MTSLDRPEMESRPYEFLLQKERVVKHFNKTHGTPLQYSCLENPMDRGAWWAAVRGVAESRT